jgi:hypothetical protein
VFWPRDSAFRVWRTYSYIAVTSNTVHCLRYRRVHSRRKAYGDTATAVSVLHSRVSEEKDLHPCRKSTSTHAARNRSISDVNPWRMFNVNTQRPGTPERHGVTCLCPDIWFMRSIIAELRLINASSNQFIRLCQRWVC